MDKPDTTMLPQGRRCPDDAKCHHGCNTQEPGAACRRIVRSAEIKQAKDGARSTLLALIAKWRAVESAFDEPPGGMSLCASDLEAAINSMPDAPVIVTLCGSTRFKDAFDEAGYRLTMAGKIVLSVGFSPAADGCHGEEIGATPAQKLALDRLHKRKIDMSDEVFVLNVGGYIGESTRSEIEHARKAGKPIYYLESINEWRAQRDVCYRRAAGYPYERTA